MDSGLSVTTPGDLDRSPISVTAGDAQTLESNGGKNVPIVECKDSSEVKSEERTSERTRRISECEKELPSVEELNETPVKQEQTAKERHKSGGLVSPGVKAEPSANTEGPPASDIQTPVKPPTAGAIPSSAQVRLDFSLSESQGSLSSLERSQGSLPDLHSSCASAPELRQSLPAAGKADLTQSASSANFDWTPVKKADAHANVYSTPPRTRWDKAREQDPSKLNGDLPHARMRHQSGPVDFRKRHLSETEATRRSSEGGGGGGFADDQISGNTNLYTSFASPKKKTLMMMRNSEALAQEQKQRLEKVEALPSDTRTSSKSLPNRTESSETLVDSTMSHTTSLQPSEPSVASRLSPLPSVSSSTNVPALVPGRTSLSASPSAGSTPPGPPTLSPHLSPARSTGGASPIMNSPSKLSMSPIPGARLSPGSSSVSPAAAVVSPPPGTPPVKRKVKILLCSPNLFDHKIIKRYLLLTFLVDNQKLLTSN